MSPRGAPGWELVLADLALILFLVTLAALAGEEAHGTGADAIARAPDNPPDIAPATAPEIAPSQALFRPGPQGPDIARWLADQPVDPRATLTVFAQYAQGERAAIWAEAQALAVRAEGTGQAVRVVITEGAQSDIHASLAYDTPIAAR